MIKKLSALFLVVCVVLFAAHFWAVRKIRNIVVDTLRRDSSYPVRLQSFRAVLPTGLFRLRGLEFKTRFGDSSVDWRIPDCFLDLRVSSLPSGIIPIERLESRGLRWKVHLPGQGDEFEGDLTLEGFSVSPPPETLPEGTIWCEKVNLRVHRPRGHLADTELELPQQLRLDLEPFTIRQGRPVLPVAFTLHGLLARNEKGPYLHASGRQDQGDRRFESDIRIVGLDVPTLLRFMETLRAFGIVDSQARKQAAEWIRGGSYTLRLSTVASPEKVSGHVTIRLWRPRFGESLGKEKVMGQPLKPFLESFEKRNTVIQLGPVSFEEDLTSPKQEAWPMIQVGLARAVVQNAPDAAWKTGRQMLENLLDR